jgi:hypothetical protein
MGHWSSCPVLALIHHVLHLRLHSPHPYGSALSLFSFFFHQTHFCCLQPTRDYLSHAAK